MRVGIGKGRGAKDVLPGVEEMPEQAAGWQNHVRTVRDSMRVAVA